MTDQERKERNDNLIEEWLDWHDSDLPKIEEVGTLSARLSEKYKITERAIYQILAANASSILSHKEKEKLRRIFRLKREVSITGKSKKDVVDLLEQLRKEFEGDKPLIDNSQHNNKTEVHWHTNGRAIDSNRLQAALSPVRHSRASSPVQSGSNGQEVGKDNASG